MSLIGGRTTRRSRFDAVEFAVVIALAFGYMTLQSVAELLEASELGHFGSAELFDAEHLAGMIRYELIAIPMIALVLAKGGWRLADFGARPTWRGTWGGIALGVAGLAILGVLQLAASGLLGGDHAALRSIPHPSPEASPGVPLFVLACLLNPVFEELLVTGFVIETLSRRFGVNAAIHASTAIRMLYHLYQGPFAFLWCGVYGLLAAHVYARWRLIWPLVVAHVIHDAVGLVFHFGALPP